MQNPRPPTELQPRTAATPQPATRNVADRVGPAGVADRGQSPPPGVDLDASLESRRSIREEYLSRPRQLLTFSPRLVSSVHLDSKWTASLFKDPEHTCFNWRRWCCTRCSTMQHAIAVVSANHERKYGGARHDDVTFSNHCEVTVNGETSDETCCCGWTAVPNHQQTFHSRANNGSHVNDSDHNVLLRGFGCTWTPTCAMVAMMLVDILTLGLPCSPCGYLGVGSACFGLQTRWLIRKQYRIIGFGVQDFMAVFCCPQCVTEQHVKELSRQGLIAEAPTPCSM